MKAAISLAQDLLADARPGEDDLLAYTGTAELAGNAALACLDASRHSPSLAPAAREHALAALTGRPEGFSRSQVFDQISVSAAGFVGIDPDQAAADGHLALDLAAQVTTSHRVTDRLTSLMDRCEPYAGRPAVREFRERLTTELAVA